MSNEQQVRIEILELKVRKLELELALMQDQLQSLTASSTVVPMEDLATKREPIASTQPSKSHQQAQPEHPPAFFPQMEQKSIDWEVLLTRVWLPRIFMFVLLIGVLWGFTAAVSAGIITESTRCLLGVAAAAIMYWFGWRQMQANRLALGQVLLGGSISVFILSVSAAHMLYGLIPYWFAFLAYGCSIALGVYTSIRYHSESLMFISMAAGYLIPFIIDSSDINIWVPVMFEVIFSITMIILSHYYSFSGSYYTAFFLLHFPLFLMMVSYSGQDARIAITSAVILQHLIIYLISLKSSLNSAIVKHPGTLLTSFFITMGWIYVLNVGFISGVYTIVISCAAILYTVTSIWRFTQKKQIDIYMSLAAFGWFLWLLDIVHFDYRASSYLLLGALVLYISNKYEGTNQKVSGTIIYVIGAFIVISTPIEKVLSVESLSWIVLMSTLTWIYTIAKHSLARIIAWGNAFLLLLFLTQITNVLTESLSYDLQHLLLSTVWVAFAISVTVYGVAADRKKVRMAGLLFLFLTLAKVILIDLPDVSTAIRAVLFIGLGTIGITVSRFLYKPNTKD
ncbi:DUF2339 domain-containing protein [Paenibacillus marinisediminis]